MFALRQFDDIMDGNADRQSIDWIANQRDWLTSATLLEAANQLYKTGVEHESK
jgi:hypothetical protein